MGCFNSKTAYSPTPDASQGKQAPHTSSSSSAAISALPRTFDAHYRMLLSEDQKLGEGQFAIVRRGVHKVTGQIVAVKCIELSRLTKEDEDALEVEVEVMRKLNHPNLVQFIDYFEGVDYNYLVMELMSGGELFTRIVEKEKYSEKEAQRLIRTLTDAMGYCHSAGVVHRDLKPENILLANDSDDAPIKIADFGFAKFDKGNAHQLSTACGTPGYVAPEILSGGKYGREVDVWSCGVIFYILLCGYPPFHSSNQARLFELIKTGTFEFDPTDWKDISEQAKDLIRKILVVDPAKRYTTSQILTHPWLLSEVSDAPLTSTLGQLKMFNARRKLRAGMNAVRSAVRVRMMLTALKSGLATPTLPGETPIVAASEVLYDNPADEIRVPLSPAAIATGGGDVGLLVPPHDGSSAGSGAPPPASAGVPAHVPAPAGTYPPMSTINPLISLPPGVAVSRSAAAPHQ